MTFRHDDSDEPVCGDCGSPRCARLVLARNPQRNYTSEEERRAILQCSARRVGNDIARRLP